MVEVGDWKAEGEEREEEEEEEADEIVRIS